MEKLPDKPYETPTPSAAIRTATNRLVESLGGTCYPKAVHSDRLSPAPKEGDDPIEMVSCDHRGVVLDLPDPETGEDVRLCVICDAVPRMPRIAQRAKEVLR